MPGSQQTVTASVGYESHEVWISNLGNKENWHSITGSASGVGVSFGITAGDGSVSANSATTDPNGLASVVFAMGSAVSGVTASAATVSGAVSGSISFNPAVETWQFSYPVTATWLASLSANDQVTDVFPGATRTFTASVQEATWEVWTSNFGNTATYNYTPLSAAGINVAFSIPSGDGSFTSMSTSTDANGLAFAAFTMGAADTVVQVDGTNGTAAMTVKAHVPVWSKVTQTTISTTVSAPGGMVSLDPGETAAITAQVLYHSWEEWADDLGHTDIRNDTYGAAAGATVTFSVEAGDGAISEAGGQPNPTATTDANGNATAIFTMGAQDSVVRADTSYATATSIGRLDFSPDTWTKCGEGSSVSVTLGADVANIRASVWLNTWDVFTDGVRTKNGSVSSSPAGTSQVDFTGEDGAVITPDPSTGTGTAYTDMAGKGTIAYTCDTNPLAKVKAIAYFAAGWSTEVTIYPRLDADHSGIPDELERSYGITNVNYARDISGATDGLTWLQAYVYDTLDALMKSAVTASDNSVNVETGETITFDLIANSDFGPLTYATDTTNLSLGTISLTGKTVTFTAGSTAGTSSFQFTASDGRKYYGKTATATVSVTVTVPTTTTSVLRVTTTSMSDGTKDMEYSASLAATGGTGSYTWSASGLPTGLSMSTSGAISGTPSEWGNFAVAVTVQDAVLATASKTLSLKIVAETQDSPNDPPNDPPIENPPNYPPDEPETPHPLWWRVTSRIQDYYYTYSELHPYGRLQSSAPESYSKIYSDSPIPCSTLVGRMPDFATKKSAYTYAWADSGASFTAFAEWFCSPAIGYMDRKDEEDAEHKRVYLEIYPAPTEAISRKMLKVTKRTINGGDPTYAVESITVTIAANKTKSDPVDLIPTFTAEPNGSEASEWVRVSLLPVEMMVDANRDGEMSFTDAAIHGKDGTTAAKPYQFWINDDYDVGDSDQASGSPDWQKDAIDQKRDLEDFARLWISLNGLVDMVRTGGVTLQLEWKPMDGSTTWPADAGNPWIKVFPAAESDGGKKYVEEESVAAQQLSAPYKDTLGLVGKNAPRTLTLPTQIVNGLSETNPNIYLLFEGASAGKGRLVLNLLKGTQKIGEYPPLYLDIRNIKRMYERWTVSEGPFTNDNGGPPNTIVRLAKNGLGFGETPFSYDVNGPEEKTYIVLAHGWNMSPNDRDNFAETAFKRLWRQGYKGRFAAFQWPTTYGFAGDIRDLIWQREHYDNGEFCAWQSAGPLSQLLLVLNQFYPNQIYLMGHSMGNVVCGEALRLLGRGGNKINSYVAMEAAVPAECYDAATSQNFPLQYQYNHPRLGGPFNYESGTSDAYRSWLVSTSAGVGRKVSFYNENDFALYEDIWEFNEISKPDNTGLGKHWGWGPPGNFNILAGDDRFWSMNPGTLQLSLGNLANVGDRYEIMSYASEPRSRALGRTPGNLAGFNETVNMRTLWPADANNHKGREWHSGQFNFNNMKQKAFWNQILLSFKLKAAE